MEFTQNILNISVQRVAAGIQEFVSYPSLILCVYKGSMTFSFFQTELLHCHHTLYVLFIVAVSRVFMVGVRACLLVQLLTSTKLGLLAVSCLSCAVTFRDLWLWCLNVCLD